MNRCLQETSGSWQSSRLVLWQVLHSQRFAVVSRLQSHRVSDLEHKMVTVCLLAMPGQVQQLTVLHADTLKQALHPQQGEVVPHVQPVSGEKGQTGTTLLRLAC